MNATVASSSHSHPTIVRVGVPQPRRIVQQIPPPRRLSFSEAFDQFNDKVHNYCFSLINACEYRIRAKYGTYGENPSSWRYAGSMYGLQFAGLLLYIAGAIESFVRFFIPGHQTTL